MKAHPPMNRSRFLPLAALAMLAVPAHAATITGDRLDGTAYLLDAGQFTTLSTAFDTRGSVTSGCGTPADGRAAILKCADDPVPDGRYNPDPTMPWIDSADVGLLKWTPVFDTKVRAFGFGVTDAADTPTLVQPSPFWRLTVDDASVEHPRRFNDAGEPVTWYTILFDAPVSTASLIIRTAAGDGYGIVSATVAPVPLPAAGWLLIAAAAALVAARRRVAGGLRP